MTIDFLTKSIYQEVSRARAHYKRVVNYGKP